jgi:putative ABC transport system substrate-binding protein
MKRRQFITLLGGAAAWPVAARGQQQASAAVIGFLHSSSPGPFAPLLAAFRRGLNEQGFVEGRNLTIEYRWAEGHLDRLPTWATELVRRKVAVIVAAGGNLSVLAARDATSSIPIVFPGMDDAVKLGVVASFNRPGGNVTGVSIFNAVLGPKRLELLRELLPRATTIGVLVNPQSPTAEEQIRELQAATSASGQRLHVINASSVDEIDAAFATMKESHPDALLLSADPLYLNQNDQLIVLAARDRLPTIYTQREFAVIGGLISYGVSFPENYRQAGVYVARILKGEKPADLPVVQPIKFELVINMKTAKALELVIPANLLALADEVIE